MIPLIVNKLSKNIFFSPSKGFNFIKLPIHALKERYFRNNWHEETNPALGNDNVAIVIVNFNTIELISLLLFSIFRNHGTERIAKIVVVDNNSQDGSQALLKALEKEDLISLICNKKQKYHGPALNQGLKYLLQHKKEIKKPFKYIWILDSDVIILNRNTIKDSISFISSHKAAVVGEFQSDGTYLGNPHVSSILIDPSLVWNRNNYAFINDGYPSSLFYKGIRKNGMEICDFPYRSNNNLLHLGMGTLTQIFKNDFSTNQYFKWAEIYHNYHFHGNKNGAMILEAIRKLFISEVDEFTKENICRILLLEQSLHDKFDSINSIKEQ